MPNVINSAYTTPSIEYFFTHTTDAIHEEMIPPIPTANWPLISRSTVQTGNIHALILIRSVDMMIGTNKYV